MATLKFAPWSSDIELSLYTALANLKINHDKLDDAARKIVGRYEVRPSDPPERSARMQIHGNAFTAEDVPSGFCRAEGILRNVNTMEEYKNIDRLAIIEGAGRTDIWIWEAILDGSIYSCPSLLASFYAIFFADLKKYKFTYHFAYPALHSDPPWKLTEDTSGGLSSLEPSESRCLFDAVQTWKYSVDRRQHGFFLAKRRRPTNIQGDQSDKKAGAGTTKEHPGDLQTTSNTSTASDIKFEWAVASLSSFEDSFFTNSNPEDCFVCFADPSTYSQGPGWMLRNLLVLAQQRWRLRSIQILCYRDTHTKRDQSQSLILHLTSSMTPPDPSSPPPNMPKVTGWEKAPSQKLTSRTVDLAEYMDPTRLADQSVDLNLKLMKWRIAPELDLDVVRDSRCLLLGAGTLGSYVARNLLGWGVRNITFVDNAKVSFSNPVRQPLFGFRDCVAGGVDKAERAAEALREIYPGVEGRGLKLSVPMAGHPVADEGKEREEFETLERLVEEHDALFLLMDSRESRWLPTVLGKAKGKVVMNAALGFDTYVVMRHGAKLNAEDKPESSLGCYFCNDVVAPADSLKDLTLDQQCTVTRPGIAAIASALLVELLISILQHPLRSKAPAPVSKSPNSTTADESTRQPTSFTHPLGLLPHQIRGFLSSFSSLSIQGPAYDACSACSPKVLAAYERDGWGFVRRVLNERGFIEEVSGLAEVQRRAEEAAKALEEEEEEDELEETEEIDGDGELL